MDDEVLLQSWRTDARAFERHRDAWVAPDVPDFLVLGQVPGNEFIAVDADPNARHLRTTVPVQRDEMREDARLDQLASAVRQLGHAAIRSGRHSIRLLALAQGRCVRASLGKKKHQ